MLASADDGGLRRLLMLLFVLYGILLVGGMIILGISFSLPAFQALVFVVGLLMIAAAVAVPITASAIEQRR
ncbi:hypothetical protein ACH3VR_00375 [Microbacterium sp. B2969]|uniref:Uncharacterized protein n=1 Tax=Microbacterium alkaliflavum TaxID=3248839 RepID=A0ABW7Q254_9MICO